MGKCKIYKKQTGNNVEVHYTPIKNINSSRSDIIKLGDLLKDSGINIKFLKFNTNEMIDAEPADDFEIQEAIEFLQSRSNQTAEYYLSPGLKIGASCGSFKIEKYKDLQKEDGTELETYH